MSAYKADGLEVKVRAAARVELEQARLANEEVPVHQALAEMAKDIVAALGKGKPGFHPDGSGPVIQTPWYENPDAQELLEGQTLSYGLVMNICGDTYRPGAVGVLVRIAAPSPVVPGMEIEAFDTRAVINVVSRFVSESGVGLDGGPYRGVIDQAGIEQCSGNKGIAPTAIAADSQHFRDTKATLEFIAQAAGLDLASLGAEASAQA